VSTKPTTTDLEWTDLDQRAVDTVRVLAMDAVQKVGNGHPGTAMSLAPAAYLVFQKLMRHDPNSPDWAGRDRFVLSVGHSSLTLYIQLYLAGYGLEMDDLKSFRTWGSRTPGHPEHGHTVGVETTTGPLGQGFGNAVGMAMAARYERGLYDPDAPAGTSPFDHTIWCFASDGDLEEGISSEASSLAGTQRLGNLTLIYDQNRISIEDDTNISFSEDVAKRYEAYGWDVHIVDWRRNTADDEGGYRYVEDVDELLAAIEAGKKVRNKPTLVLLKTIIAWPAPTKQNTGKSHGSALGDDEVNATHEILGFSQKRFPAERAVLAHARKVVGRGKAAHKDWNKRYAAWRKANPDKTDLLDRLVAGKVPAGLGKALPTFSTDTEKGMSTRAASGKVLEAIADVMPELWGGSADLAESNNTTMTGQPSFIPTDKQTEEWKGGPGGRTLHFGIREFGMGCILNGIALEGLTRPYGGTFLVFSDYMRGAVRLAAIQGIPVTFVWTHDSIGLGEDGPTHQPVEHLAALRAMPGLDVVRPADANETAVCWETILDNAEPAGLVLTRQNLPIYDRKAFAKAANASKGAYVLVDGGKNGKETPDVILIATGSEVSIAVDARTALEKAGIRTRVVSMPCREWFERQTKAYRDRVLPPSIRARVSIEAAVGLGWRDYVGDAGRIISLEHFGASADYKTLYREFGITPEATVRAAKDSLKAAKAAAVVAPVKDVNPRSAQNGSLTDTSSAQPASKKATVAAR
jgi:transketolase